MRRNAAAWLLLLALGSTGCGGGSGGSRPQALPVEGAIDPATPGTTVYLLGPDGGERTLDQLAACVEQVVEPGADGHFQVTSTPGSKRLLVSAPGSALAWHDLAEGELRVTIGLRPESRLRVQVLGEDGLPEAEALALVLDGRGVPLPLPADQLISDAAGDLVVRRLPPGPVELLVSGLGRERFGFVQASPGPGEEVAVRVVLKEDPELLRRFLGLMGVDLPVQLQGGRPR